MNTAILKSLCSLPTAPFAEHHVLAWVDRFAAARPNLKLTRDEFGNVLLELKSEIRNPKSEMKRPRWIFAAHTDHPGFVAHRMTGPRTLEAAFHGWVQIE